MFFEHFRRVIAAKCVAPGHDVLSKLINTSHDEASTEAELIDACSMLLFAGHDTVRDTPKLLSVFATDSFADVRYAFPDAATLARVERPDR